MAIIKANTKLKVDEPVFFFNGDVDLGKHGKVVDIQGVPQNYKILWDGESEASTVPCYNVVSERDGLDFIEDADNYQDIDEIDDWLITAGTDIEAAFKPTSANQYANTFSNYAYNHLDTAYKYDKSVGNIFDIYMITETDPQIDIKINVTTYADKIRINVFYTGTKDLIVSVILQPKKFTNQASESNLNYLLERIYNRLRKLGKIK